MALIVHRAERADVLAEGLAGLLAEPPEDPFEPDVVVVAAEGVQRWLAQTLSHRLGAAPGREDGICAGVEFVRPRHFIAELTEKDLEDPWSPGRLVWTVLDVLDASLHEPWLWVVAQHLGIDRDDLSPAETALRRDRRYSTARRTASLLHDYALQRPWMVQAWTTGDDTDGNGHQLAPECRWQAELWRRVTDRLSGHPSPNLRLAATAAGLTDGSLDPNLPARLSFVGHTRMPAAELDLLSALAGRREVHLWLPHPSRARWEAVAAAQVEAPALRGSSYLVAPQGPGGQEAAPEGNTLLTTCARDITELEIGLLSLPTEVGVEHLPPPDRPDTLLGWLQTDLTVDWPSDPNHQRALRTDDRSIQIHACHGPARQVDVLRETILGLLQDDPTLEPRDVLVMCPDVETFAPLIQAAFGLDDVAGIDHPGHQLRVRLADRAISAVNPVAQALHRIVTMATGGRVTATDVRDLLSLAPVRHRFELSDDDLEQIGVWISDTSIRWGLDGDGRSSWGLGGLEQNTWNAGLDRLVLGVTAEPGLPGTGNRLGGVLGIDDLGSTVVDLVGRFSQAIARLRSFLNAAAPQTVDNWTELLADTVLSMTSTPPHESWQTDQVLRDLARLIGDEPTSVELTIGEVEAMLGDLFSPRPTRTNFRTGSLTVCTMVPMRSVPHRVVCLLGLDSQAFPRTPTPLGDDILARDRLVGERDATGEDRQLFLDAILAATENLVITYTGASEHTGRQLPPATPVGELLDQLDRTVPGGDVRTRVVIRHPLQAFDARAFTPGALVPERPFSFDPAGLAGAKATLRQPASASPFLGSPLPEHRADVITLEEFRTFLAHPVRSFVRGTLDVTLRREDDPADDDIPLSLDALERWQVSSRLLEAVLAGASGHDAEADERRRGLLPPGLLAEEILSGSRELVQRLYALAAPLISEPAATIDLDLTLPDGRRIVGSVPDVHPRHGLRVSPSRIGAKPLAAAWLDTLMLAASPSGLARPFHLVGRARRGGAAAVQTIAPPLQADALSLLSDLAGLYALGRRAPLPLPLKTSFTLAENLRRTNLDVATKMAANDWTGNRDRGIDGEDVDPYHVLVFGAGVSYQELRRLHVDQLTIDQLAPRLWNPILDHLGATS